MYKHINIQTYKYIRKLQMYIPSQDEPWQRRTIPGSAETVQRTNIWLLGTVSSRSQAKLCLHTKKTKVFYFVLFKFTSAYALRASKAQGKGGGVKAEKGNILFTFSSTSVHNFRNFLSNLFLFFVFLIYVIT